MHSCPTSQQAGRGQARVFTLTPQDAQASNAVVTGTILVCYCDARVLFDPGATHSFITSVFASRLLVNLLEYCILFMWRLL